MKFIRSEFMPAASNSRPPTRRSPRLNSHRGAVRLEVDDLPANWLDDDFEISVMTLVGRRLRRLQYPRFGLLLGSVVRQFGHSADLAISSGLALLAVAAQYILRRMRQLDGSGPEWIHRKIGMLRKRLERLLGRLRVEALAAWLYPKIDLDGVELHPHPHPHPQPHPQPQPQPHPHPHPTRTHTLTLPAPTPSRSTPTRARSLALTRTARSTAWSCTACACSSTAR